MTTEATTRCAVAGGGPGGVVLAYLLARAGVPVTLLESRPDFDRRFRGDALAPPVLELLDALGLAQPLLAEVPHGTADAFVWRTPTRAYRLADYRRTSATYPYYALVPQGRFLPFLVERASAFPGFRVGWVRGIPRCCAPESQSSGREGAGRVNGVEYTRAGERHRCGRTWSSVRTGATRRCAPSPRSPPPSWARTSTSAGTGPRRDGDPELSGLELIAEPGATLAVLGQAASWQLGYTIPAGTFPELRAGGIGPVAGALTGGCPGWATGSTGSPRSTSTRCCLCGSPARTGGASRVCC